MLLRARGSAFPSNTKHGLEYLVQFGRDVFPTLCVAYRLLLTLGFSIVSCKRSFLMFFHVTRTPDELGFNQ